MEIKIQACVYGCLLLHDAKIEITVQNLKKVTEAAGLKIESFLLKKFTISRDKIDKLIWNQPNLKIDKKVRKKVEKIEPKKEEVDEEEEDCSLDALFGVYSDED